MSFATYRVATLDDHGHAPTFERFFSAQLHCVSCKTEPDLNSGAVFLWFALTTIGHHSGAVQAPGLRLHPVIKHSPAHVYVYVLTMQHGYVGVC